MLLAPPRDHGGLELQFRPYQVHPGLGDYFRDLYEQLVRLNQTIAGIDTYLFTRFRKAKWV
ncbi:MAG: hypothetical protein FJY51_05335 [Betaproteobacteria bacterium]|nr:hypothetical protein [Betaproteobacteria bacterium]